MKRVEENNIKRKTVEDYLEAILIVFQRQGYVRSVDLADQLGVSKPSVTYATKKLRDDHLIETDHAGMLLLTDSGRKIAEQTLNRHQVLTKFFVRIGVAPEQAQQDACKIEHDISEASFKALCDMLAVKVSDT